MPCLHGEYVLRRSPSPGVSGFEFSPKEVCLFSQISRFSSLFVPAMYKTTIETRVGFVGEYLLRTIWEDNRRASFSLHCLIFIYNLNVMDYLDRTRRWFPFKPFLLVPLRALVQEIKIVDWCVSSLLLRVFGTLCDLVDLYTYVCTRISIHALSVVTRICTIIKTFFRTTARCNRCSVTSTVVNRPTSEE